MAGLLCTYQLAQAVVDYVLAEANRICSGITKNTITKITVQYALTYDKLIREFGVERAQLYLEANQAAPEEYRALYRSLNCDFEEKDVFVYSVEDRRKLERELNALSRLDFAAEFSESVPLPFPVAGAMKMERQAQFHPSKFIATIAGNLRVFEHTKVLELAPGKVLTSHGAISEERSLPPPTFLSPTSTAAIF